MTIFSKDRSLFILWLALQLDSSTLLGKRASTAFLRMKNMLRHYSISWITMVLKESYH